MLRIQVPAFDKGNKKGRRRKERERSLGCADAIAKRK